MIYELNDQVKNNLVLFLQRVDLKGSEVGAYVEILKCLQNPIMQEVKGDN